MRKDRRKECGAIEVEATIILPITILCVLLLLYLSLFFFQRANLQACLETALVYYKNTATDNYVTRNDELEFALKEGSYVGSGNSYVVNGPLNPYRQIFARNKKMADKDSFETYFRSIAGNMLWNDSLQLDIYFKNMLVVKQFKATAVQVVDIPIDFSILGIDNKFVITAAAKINVTDHDNLIRNVDYAIYLIDGTKFGNWCSNFASKFSEGYSKMKEFLNVNS